MSALEPSEYNFARKDIEALIHLLGEVAIHTGDISQKRRFILTGLAILIDCDAWWWVHSTVRDGNAYLFSMIDAGWRSDHQRMLATSVHYTPHVEFMNRHFLCHFERGEHVTRTRQQILPDELWHTSPMYLDYFRPAEIEDFMGDVYPLENKAMSSMGFHRFRGKPLFSDRDRDLAHLFTSQVDWLHRVDIDTPAARKSPGLSPRRRQLLLLLLNGDSTMQMAQHLHLSEHTVNDHLKVIHKHFNVSSRSELPSLFIQGGKM